MAIATAIQRGSVVVTLNEQGNVIGMIPCSNKPDDGLKGYTATTVTIKKGNTICVLDERGNVKSMFQVQVRILN